MVASTWQPLETPTPREKVLLARLTRTKKLFGFLRQHRRTIFDDAFQAELQAMYRSSEAGKAPVPPALLAMATLLQAYCGASDAEAVELSLVDARWQMVLDNLDGDSPAFSQGALQSFRQRLIAHDMDRRILERTVAVARELGGFDPKKLRKLNIAVDSRPLTGAGRVEDTINLLAHCAGQLLQAAADMVGTTPEDVAEELNLITVAVSSVKAALDVDWSDDDAKVAALQRVVLETAAIELWVEARLPKRTEEPPLSDILATLQRLREQNLEPDPSGHRCRIKEGVAPDRQISLADPQMRHGRKSKTKAFNGYKSHLAVSLEEELILACAVTPANEAEAQALPVLRRDIGDAPDEWHFDLGYVAAAHVCQRDRADIVCKPWRQNNGGLFTKADFRIDLRRRLATCPAGKTTRISPGKTACFDDEDCDRCGMRPRCTKAQKGHGRTLHIHTDEALHKKLRSAAATPKGRHRLRQRVGVEHRLAHHAQKQGTRARYLGLRNNVFDSRRHAAVLNLEVADRRSAA